MTEKAKKYYAHSSPDESEADWQSLDDHLKSVGQMAAKSASHFGAEELAEVSGLLHDLGKYCSEFQQRLRGSKRRVDHATWGAKIAFEKYGPQIGSLLAYGIAGHHAGLADGSEDIKGQTITPLTQRLTAELETQLDPIWQEEIELVTRPAMPPLKLESQTQLFQLSILGRMLYSCLVDADFIDTDNYYRAIKAQPPRNNQYPTIRQLKKEVDQYLSQSKFQDEEGINAIRKRILAHVRNQAKQAPGLFSLNVPTGGGKTLSSLAFALDHAARHGQRRIILVIPFTSIVEQNAKVWREALGPYGEKALLEHHSAFDQEKMEFRDPASKDKLRLAAENWDAPIIVTTAVQFFESLFANRSSRCRKLHNIANSVVILDEVQTLPVKLLLPCVAMIKELAVNYRSSMVLCTATQPALLKREDFARGLENVRELAPNPEQLHKELERVTVIHIGPMTDEALVDEMMEQHQVLCIVNNRRHARSLFDQLRKKGVGAYHLTTLMCAEHRSAVLDEIRKKLKSGEVVRLVSTSLIEAGVDVDFPNVYRAEAGLDSVAQAAGRCNREGRYGAEVSLVKVFQVADDWPEPPELAQYASAFRTVYRHHVGRLLLPEAVEAFFNEVYWLKGDELDHHKILTSVKRVGQELRIPYERMAQQFTMIESNMKPVIVKYKPRIAEIESLLNDLQFADQVGGIARKLQRYLVQVPEQALKVLMKSGAVAPINQERFGYQFLLLESGHLYDKECGLSWEDLNCISGNDTVL